MESTHFAVTLPPLVSVGDVRARHRPASTRDMVATSSVIGGGGRAVENDENEPPLLIPTQTQRPYPSPEDRAGTSRYSPAADFCPIFSPSPSRDLINHWLHLSALYSVVFDQPRLDIAPAGSGSLYVNFAFLFLLFFLHRLF